jgi:hypothetical protein
MTVRRSLLVLLSLAGLPAAVSATALAAGTQQITPSGVGQVKLHATYAFLHSHGLVGTIHKGCELAGPNARAADLKAPLKGSVDFTMTSARKVTDITVRGGATARGVGIGATIAQIKAKFPKAVVDHSTESTFGTTLVKIPKNGGGRLQFAVDIHTHKAVLIGIPFIATCD